MVKTIHGKVRYGGVKLLVVYLSWCCVSHWLSWKLSSSDSSNTGQKGRCGCMHILLTCAALRKTVQKMHAYRMLPFPTSAFLCFPVSTALHALRSPSPQLFLPSLKIFLSSFQLSFAHSHLRLPCRNHYLPFPQCFFGLRQADTSLSECLLQVFFLSSHVLSFAMSLGLLQFALLCISPTHRWTFQVSPTHQPTPVMN